MNIGRLYSVQSVPKHKQTNGQAEEVNILFRYIPFILAGRICNMLRYYFLLIKIF